MWREGRGVMRREGREVMRREGREVMGREGREVMRYEGQGHVTACAGSTGTPAFGERWYVLPTQASASSEH